MAQNVQSGDMCLWCERIGTETRYRKRNGEKGHAHPNEPTALRVPPEEIQGPQAVVETMMTEAEIPAAGVSVTAIDETVETVLAQGNRVVGDGIADAEIQYVDIRWTFQFKLQPQDVFATLKINA